ncbi:MAG TPA: hypothetical protein VKE53_02770 [Pseudolabrys sp.]|nr:hypothetical protein [Pseudolabrys sp.]
MKRIAQPVRSGIENAARSDRNWFDRNPHRTYRVRRMISGEFPQSGQPDIDPAKWSPWTLVKQIAPGVRLRLGLYVKSGAEPIDADWLIAPLFSHLENGLSAGQISAFSATGKSIMQAFMPPAHVLNSNNEGGVQ